MSKKNSTQPHKKAELSAGSKRIFTYPKKMTSACAEILACLLAGGVLTAEDSYKQVSTMRIAAHAYYLSNILGWPIMTESRAVGCADGRMALIAAYSLPAACIHEARAAGAVKWCAAVRKARAELRKNAAEAKRRAKAINKAMRKKSDPNQGDLFNPEKDGE